MKTKHIIAAAMSALILAACGHPPAAVTEHFYMDVSQGKIDEAISNMDLPALAEKGISREKLKAGLTADSNKLNNFQCGGLKDVKIISQNVRGEIAVQKVQLECHSGKTMAATVQLIKGKDGWQIVNL